MTTIASLLALSASDLVLHEDKVLARMIIVNSMKSFDNVAVLIIGIIDCTTKVRFPLLQKGGPAGKAGHIFICLQGLDVIHT